ncbi:SDR family NAD(P)-dependent oxidoreductase [Bacteroidota bacterium]
MEKKFRNKHVLVTGGARGLGFEIATEFVKAGALVTIFDTHEQNLENARQKLSEGNGKVFVHLVDVSNQDEVKKGITRAESVAPVDILINNAGIAYETSFLEISAEEWRSILDINLTGMFFVAQEVCKLMARREKGIVVNMGSKNGLDGEYGYAHYNSSKGGVAMLTKTMALELAQYNIRVNMVCPGYIQTPMSEEIDSPEFVANFANRYIPMGRPGKPHEVAPMFLFLASDESSFITGQTFVIDGGQLAGQNPDPAFM